MISDLESIQIKKLVFWHRSIRNGSLLVLLAVGLTSCFSSSGLRRNEYLLYGQTIRGNKEVSTLELEQLIPQKPNRRILRLPITPGLWVYQVGSRQYDREKVRRELEGKIKEYQQAIEQLPDSSNDYRTLTKRYNRKITRLRRKTEEGNWVMRVLGEPPAYFLRSDAQANAEKIQRYLYNKGFFENRTTYAIDSILGRRIRVTYRIQENIPFIIRSVSFQISDPQVNAIVHRTMGLSLLKARERFDAIKIENERVRIEELLRNHGYYAFSRKYILTPEADSIPIYNHDSTARELNLVLTIANPPGQRQHSVFHIGEVDVRIARSETQFVPDTTYRNGIRYLLGQQRYSIRLLDSRIFLRPDSLYRINNYRETQRQLFLLNQFRFANINFVDTTRQRIKTSINLVPIDKYELTAESGLNINNFIAIVPGPFVNLGLQIHNAFGGMETFEASLRGSIEGSTGYTRVPNSYQDDVFISTQFGVNTSINLPHILFPGPVRFRFNTLTPKTALSIGYNYVNRYEYTRANARAAITYSWQKNTKHLYSFAIADLNLLYTTRLNSEFEQGLRDEQQNFGNPLIYSFTNSTLLSSMVFTYTYNTNALGQNNRGNFLRASLESSGTTLNLINNKAINTLSNQTGLNFYKFLRANIDFRHYIPLTGKSLLAFRLSGGLLYTYFYTGENRTSPYEKYFFAGGSNSIRAWRLRALGPGSTYPKRTNTKDPEGNFLPEFRIGRDRQFEYRAEKPAEILLEGSAELRGRLFHLGADFNYAIFTDVGNTWNLFSTGNTGELFRWKRGASSHELPFYQQLAVGTGIGLRIDVSFFVIRLDGGIKIYDAARRYYDETNGRFIDERFFLPQFSFKKLFKGPNPLVVQFGIGYPF